MAQIKNKFIADNAVSGSKIRLGNNESLRARNVGDSADVELLKLDTSDILQFLSHPQISTSASGDNDVLTLKDLNQELEGLKPKEACRAATEGDIVLSAPQTIDGVSVVAGDRVLVKAQTVPAENGIYVVAAGAWSRSDDMDSLTPVDEVNGAYTFVQEGTENEGKGFVQQGTVGTIGVDPINFVYFNSVADLSGGDGIDLSSNVISVDLSGSPYLEFDGGQLQAKVSADYASAAAGDVMDAADIKTKVDAVEVLAAGKQDPISGQDAIDVTSDVVSLTLDGATLAQSVSGVKIADGGVDELQLSSNVDAESLVVATGYVAAAGTVTVGDTVQEALEKIEGKVDAVSIPVIQREVLTLDGTDISNGYVDLAATPLASSVLFEVSGAPSQIEGIDWSVSTNIVTFLGELASGGAAALESGDVLQVTYRS
jgi:hypothetical protein